MPRERFIRQSLGVAQKRLPEVSSLLDHSQSTHILAQAKVLLVGAGGIGCELLKNLVLTGFGEVHVIDLDTIDLSNLNRQFLFRHEHIKKSKALVAKEAAQRFNPNVKLEAYHSNIKDSTFNVAWFSQFTLVFNALDNLDARRHVNKMCLAADVPLIESGTTGFNGQVQVIKKGVTACYDCTPKETPKSFPVCTIRSTPSQPIHCIVWGKSYLLPELFGESEDAVPELDVTEDSENAEEIAKLKEEAEALKKIRESMGSDDFAKQVFDKVFKDDIERLAKMEDMWKEKSAPESLSYDKLEAESSGIDASISQSDQNVWSTAENFVVFRDSLSRLAKRLAEDQANASKNNLPSAVITFDKDDEDTLDLVTATANLRAQIFGIVSKSKFDIKQMAGNIIPAIATTNAMIAGLCVLQAFKVIKGEYPKTKMVFLDRGNISSSASEEPNPSCVVCGNAMARLQYASNRATLGDLVKEVLKAKLGYGDEISILSEKGLIYDPDLDDNLEKKFEELDIKAGSFLTIKDEMDEDETPRIDLQLSIEISSTEGDDAPVVSLVLKEGETLEIARKPKKPADAPITNGEADAVGENGTAVASVLIKRKRDANEAELEADGTVTKKAKPDVTDLKGKGRAVEPEVMVIEEDDGTIMIDDD
jgi:ubiquitin-like 1-activating enzyme E1 B